MLKGLLFCCYNIIRKTSIFSIIFFIVLACTPKIVFSATGNVSVSAFVDSLVSASLSTITVSAPESIADNIAIVTIIVTVVDKDGNPLENKKVVLHSNRGFVDKIMTASNEDYSDESYTNILGQAIFKIKTDTAGKATFTAFVDNSVTLIDTATIIFKRPPAPTPITITTTIPPMFGMPEKTITLFKPARGQGTDALVEQGIDIKLPFSMFLAGGFFALSQPVLLSVIIVQSIRGRKREEELEERLIADINNKEHV